MPCLSKTSGAFCLNAWRTCSPEQTNKKTQSAKRIRALGKTTFQDLLSTRSVRRNSSPGHKNPSSKMRGFCIYERDDSPSMGHWISGWLKVFSPNDGSTVNLYTHDFNQIIIESSNRTGDHCSRSFLPMYCRLQTGWHIHSALRGNRIYQQDLKTYHIHLKAC